MEEDEGCPRNETIMRFNDYLSESELGWVEVIYEPISALDLP